MVTMVTPRHTIVYTTFVVSAFTLVTACWYLLQLRLAIVEALGHMTHLMARDKLEEQLPRLLAGIVGLYKRHPEPFHVTQVL